jgi:PAS domain S-box-containing protein
MTITPETISLLLIEDDSADAEIIRQFLLKDPAKEYQISNVVLFSDALDRIQQSPPDVALLDLNLPDSASEDTLRKLKEQDLSIPVIVLTGNNDQELGVKAMQCGAQVFLTKETDHYRTLPQTIQFAIERYRTLQALQESEERYRLLSEVASDYMFAARVEPDGSVIQQWTAGAVKDTTGYALDEYLVHGGWRSIIHPDDLEIDDQDMEDLYARKKISSELRIIKKDGTIAWVQVKGFPVWDEESDRLAGIVGSTMDITQRKENEISLRNSEQRFKTMFDEAPLGIGLTNAHTGEYQQVNKFFTEIIGYSEQELLTMKWMEITHPDDIDLDMSHMNRLNAGEIKAFQIEKRYIKNDGSAIWVNMKVTPVTIPGVEGDYVMSMVEDITASKTAQKRLIESENRFRLLYEQAPIPYQSLDEDGMLLDINDAWLDELGYQRKEVVGEYFAKFLSDQDAELFPQNFTRFKELGEIQGIEYKMLHKDQHLIDVSFDGRIVRDTAGRFLQTHCVFANITERKANERAAQKNTSRLESLAIIQEYPYEDIDDFLDFALGECVTLTESKVGYIFFYDEDVNQFQLNSYSREVNGECQIELPKTVYDLEETGLWGEVVRQRGSIRINDFQADNPLKKGYPEGHVHLENFLSIPILSDDQIVAVVGVANKETDYNHDDELQMTLLMNHVWKIVERNTAREELTDISHRLQHYTNSSPVIIFAYEIQNDEVVMTWSSDNPEKILGYSKEEINSPEWWIDQTQDQNIFGLEDVVKQVSLKQESVEQDYYITRKSGERIWINEKITVLFDANLKPIEAISVWTDITVRKQIEASAAESAARLETALSNMADAVYLTDARGNVTHFNQATAEFFRFKTKDECSSHFDDWASLIEVMSTDGKPVLRKNWSINRALRGETESNIEYMFRRIDTGETWYGRYNFAPIHDDRGNIIGSVVTGTDITEQKELLKSIQQYAEDLNKAQAVANVGSWKWNVLTNELTWSDQMYTIFGIDKDEFTGHLPDVIDKAIHPEDRPAVEASNTSVAEHGKPIPVEYRIIHPGGTIRTVWAEAGELVTDEEGNPMILSGIVQDITERKRTETQLLLQDAALNSAANGIVITDFSGSIQWANPAFAELTGYTLQEAIGKNPRQLLKSGEHDQQYYRQMWDTIMNGDTWRGEIINHRKDGTHYTEYMTITPIQDTGGKITNFIAIKEDISLRKEHENRIQQHLVIQEQLVKMGRAFSSIIDIQLIYRTAYRYISEIIDVANMGITLYNAEKNGLHRVFAINEGIVMDTSQFSILPYEPESDRSLRTRVIATQQPYITNKLAEKENQFGSIFVNTRAMAPQSAIYVPLVGEHKVLGVMELQSYTKDAFTEESSEWLSVVANQIALAHQNANLYAQIRDRVSQLSGLREIDSAINGHQPLDFIYQIVFNQIRYHIRPDAADILLLPDGETELIYESGYGFNQANDKKVKIPLEHVLARICVESKKQVVHNQPDQYDDDLADWKKWNDENFVSYIGIPIVIHHKCVGVLEVFHRYYMNPHPDELQYLQTLAGQVAIAIESNSLISDLQDTANDLMKAYDATIEGWSMAMDLRDRDTEGHTQRVTELAVKLAEAAGYPKDQMEHLRRGALLHDIGKLGVPDYILLKPGKLDEDEWERMKQHPTMAYEMLKQVEYLLPALDIPRYHHERWDGSGYPEGLAGEEIPLSARIFAFVDVWDAVTNDRPYKEAWSKEKALQLIKDDAGSHFDPRLAEIFVELILSEEEKNASS